MGVLFFVWVFFVGFFSETEKKKRRKCIVQNSIVGSGFEPVKENASTFKYFITSLGSAEMCNIL